MADINQVISLGIGVPSGIPEFLTFGLQIGAVVDVSISSGRLFQVHPEDRIFIVQPKARVFTVT